MIPLGSVVGRWGVSGEGNWGHKSVALLDTLEKNQDAFAEIFEVRT